MVHDILTETFLYLKEDHGIKERLLNFLKMFFHKKICEQKVGGTYFSMLTHCS